MDSNELSILMQFFTHVNETVQDKVSQAIKSQPRQTFQSESIDLLAKALSQAQGSYKTLVFNRKNPMTLDVYVDIRAIHEATSEALKENELAVAQLPVSDKEGTMLYTRLLHSSGQFIECKTQITMIAGELKMFSSNLNELKKIHLMSMLGIAPTNDKEDDDCMQELLENRKIENKGTDIDHIYGTTLEDRYTRINQEQLKELDYSLSGDDMRDAYNKILKTYKINLLADLPQDQYRNVLDRVYEIKAARRKLK